MTIHPPFAKRDLQPVYDMVIVGGAAVGSSLAVACHHANPALSILVIESKSPLNNAAVPLPLPSMRSIVLNHGAIQFYQRIGVWPLLASDVTAIQQVQVSVQSRYGQTTFDAKEAGVPALGYVVGLPILEDRLKGYIQPYVDWCQPAEVIATDAIEEGWEVSFKTEQSSLQQVKAGLIIAADGVHSRLRRQQGIGLQTRSYGHCAVVCNVQTELPHRGIAFERFTKEGAMALLPFGENTMTVVWTLSPESAEKTKQWSDGTFLKALQVAFGYRLGRLQRVSRRQTHPLDMHIATSQIARRMVMMGNAAHQLHPIVAQGLNLSLRDIETLAALLGEAKERKESIGALSLLQQYVKLRTADQARVITATDGIATWYSGKKLPGWAKAMSMVMVDAMPSLKRMATRLAMGVES